MTVITYSSAAGRLPEEILVLQHPLASGNVLEPPSEIVEPQAMPDPSEDPLPEPRGVKGWRRIERRRAKGERMQKHVIGEGREERCNCRKKCSEEVRKDSKTIWKCAEGKEKNMMSVFRLELQEERIGGRQKNMGMRRHQLFIWLIFLIFSLYPNPASAQVRLRDLNYI